MLHSKQHNENTRLPSCCYSGSIQSFTFAIYLHVSYFKPPKLRLGVMCAVIHCSWESFGETGINNSEWREGWLRLWGEGSVAVVK